MGIPAEDAATQEKQEQDDNKSTPTFADRVNEAVNEMKSDDKGNYVLPEGLSEEVEFAAMAEKRRRDTVAAFTKTNQENKALKAEKSVLSKKALTNVEVKLTAAQEEELEDLKFSDPEAWRKKRNGYEAAALEQHQKELDEEVKKVSTSSLEEEEIGRRELVHKEFLKANPDFTLDIDEDIPPRIMKKLADGKVSFEDFLQECYDYSKTGKVVKQQESTLGQPNLGKVGGGSNPDKNAVKEDAIISYNKETY